MKLKIVTWLITISNLKPYNGSVFYGISTFVGYLMLKPFV